MVGGDLCPALYWRTKNLCCSGYGHLSPATDAGKAICIVYSTFGVPLNGILIGGLASFFSDKVIIKVG